MKNIQESIRQLVVVLVCRRKKGAGKTENYLVVTTHRNTKGIHVVLGPGYEPESVHLVRGAQLYRDGHEPLLIRQVLAVFDHTNQHKSEEVREHLAKKPLLALPVTTAEAWRHHLAGIT